MSIGIYEVPIPYDTFLPAVRAALERLPGGLVVFKETGEEGCRVFTLSHIELGDNLGTVRLRKVGDRTELLVLPPRDFTREELDALKAIPDEDERLGRELDLWRKIERERDELDPRRKSHFATVIPTMFNRLYHDPILRRYLQAEGNTAALALLARWAGEEPQADSSAVAEQLTLAEDEADKKRGPMDRLAFEMGQICGDKTIQVEERQESPPPIPRLTWTLVILLFLDFCLFILWGWCLIGDQPDLMAYLQTVFTIVGLPVAILGIIFVARRPIILEDSLHRLGSDAKWRYAILIVTGLSIIVTCLFWPLGWVGKCVPTPLSQPTGIAQTTPTSKATEVIVVAPTTTAPPIVTITPALTNQSSNVEPNTIGDIFPMFIGSTWSYNFGKVTQATDEQVSRILQFIGSYTETVVTIETGLSDKAKIIGVEITGENFMNHCAGDDFMSGDLDTWYVLDDGRLFQLCSRDEASAVATEMVHGQTQATSSVLPEYVAPFEVGKLWPAFPNIPPRDDTYYQWHVESRVDVSVPAGEFKDCYRLLLYTMPDTTIRWVCPGVGLVAAEYHHHGSIEEYRAELKSFQSHP